MSNYLQFTGSNVIYVARGLYYTTLYCAATFVVRYANLPSCKFEIHKNKIALPHPAYDDLMRKIVAELLGLTRMYENRIFGEKSYIESEYAILNVQEPNR